MAMPASGCIAIVSAPQTCGSISAAVCGTAQGSCLSALSVAAGKTAPHCMTEFYGFAGSYTTISLCNIGGGGCGTTFASTIGCLTPPINVAGNCYCACFCAGISATGQASGSFACVCVARNGTPLLNCCVPAGSCANPTVSFQVCCAQTIMASIFGCSTCSTCSTSAYACLCLLSITCISTKGLYCRGGTTYFSLGTW